MNKTVSASYSVPLMKWGIISSERTTNIIKKLAFCQTSKKCDFVERILAVCKKIPYSHLGKIL